MSKKIILSGIQATGRLTLGNYLGAIDNWVKMQEEYDCYYMIANLHSLTVRNDPEELKNNTLRILAIYIAAGLDPEKNTIFIGFFMCDASIQKCGFGTELINELVEYIRTLEYKAVQLAWVKGNPQSEHFWIKNGFVAIKETSSSAADNVILAERKLY